MRAHESNLKILSKLKSITLKKISDITVKYSALLISYQLIQYFFYIPILYNTKNKCT